MIDSLIEDLKYDEGFVEYAYEDSLGYLTIGYGFLIDKRRGGKIPQKIAEEWLHHEVVERWGKLTTKLPWLLNQPEAVQRAICNMAYQLGIDGVLRFKMMLTALAVFNGQQLVAILSLLNLLGRHRNS